MPAGSLEARCEQTLEEISILAQRIRRTTLAYKVNNQGVSIVEKLRRQVELVRVSCDAMLEAITLKDYTTDDRIADWLLSGEPRACLGKLKEMDEILKPDADGQVRAQSARHSGSPGDKPSAAMALFDKHCGLFHFLLTPNIWNCERFPHQLVQPPEETQMSSSAATGRDTEARRGHGENRISLGTELKGKDKKFIVQKLDAVSRWLDPLDCTEKHKQTLQLRQEGTCTWFSKTDVFKRWRTGDSQFLWLHGKAGCGKSVLIASMIEDLKKTLGNDEVIAYFYCDFRNERATSPTELMRSVLSQLCRHFCDQGIDPGDFPNKILQAKCKGTLSLDNLEKLCDRVIGATPYFRGNPIIVIDALDECADIEALVRSLARFKRHQADVRLLVTSRPHPTVMDHLVGFQSLSFEEVAKELAADIALHVMRVVDSDSRLRSANPDVKEEIYAKLTERAEGRFRWVQCQLDTLKRCGSREELKKTLDNLPKELEVTYERILEAIDERKLEGQLARRVLALLMVAFEPLQLARIVDGLAVDPERGIDRGTLGTTLLHVLSSLVSYFEETDVLTLSHFSVKEYLTSPTALPMYQLTPHEAHAEAAQTCMQYISVFLKQWPCCRNARPFQSFPMLSYVLSLGFDHLAHVNPGSTVALEAVRSLGADVRHHPSQWERLCELREEHFRWPYPPWPSIRHDFIPYILIAYSSPCLLQAFFSTYGPLKPRVGTNPLVYAADFRKTEHAMALLACGCADVDMLGFTIDDSRHALPLDIAIDAGDDVLVDKLLRRGCAVTSEVLSAAVCMPWCTTRVLVRLMQTGEFVEWACNIGEEKLYRSVFSSARPNAGDRRQADEDHVALARILRQIGQDLSADILFGTELIERALHAGHTSMLEFLLPSDEPPPPQFLLAASTGDTSETVSVVRFLLRRGVDVHAVSDGRKDTALHLAALSPWEPRSLELIKMLIDAGCRTGVRNSRGETPLTIAGDRGYISVVDHLLGCNIPLPPDILHFSLKRSWGTQIIQSLVCKGADVHVTTSSRNTLLHVAIAERSEPRCLDLVEMFIRAGCNPAARNSTGVTCLDVAIERRRLSIVEFLLSYSVVFPPDILLSALQISLAPEIIQCLIQKGADVRATSPDGCTLLHRAIREPDQSRCLCLVKIFIEGGCDPTACNIQGKTVLDVAIERGYASVVECLLLSPNVLHPPDVLLSALRIRVAPEIIQSLVRMGADVHSATSNGDTVLHLAIAGYINKICLELVKIFIKAGCNPTARNSKGKTVLAVAIERGHLLVVELLLSHDVPFPPDILLFMLRKRATFQIIQPLICKGANVHSTTSNKDTILHVVITEYAMAEDVLACWELVKIFIQAGCDPTACNSKRKTFLDVAIECGLSVMGVVERLLSHDIPLPPDILLFVLRRRAPLHLVEFLIHKGADVHDTLPNGDTALHLAIVEYAEGISHFLVKKFIQAGCNPITCNSNGRPMLKVAIEHGYTSVVELLLSYNIPLPPNVLSLALQRRCTPLMIQLLVDNGAFDLTTAFAGGSDQRILRLVHASYLGADRQRVIEILDVASARSGRMRRLCPSPGPEDETPVHIAKRPRLTQTD